MKLGHVYYTHSAAGRNSFLCAGKKIVHNCRMYGIDLGLLGHTGGTGGAEMKKTNDAARWWNEEKGFYMVLLLCVLAVAVAAYVLFVSPQTVEADPMDGYLYEADDSVSASEPLDRVPAMDTESQDTDEETETAAPAEQTEQSEPAAAEQPEEQTAEQTAAALTFTPPMETDISHAFSGDTLEYNESTRDWRTHNGADYAGSEGDAVHAIADGTVIRVGEDAIYGKYVILSHAQDMNSLYAGLDAVSVQEGDSVKGGDSFAELGNPMPLEQALGVHLHLEVTRDGDAIDPASLF